MFAGFYETEEEEVYGMYDYDFALDSRVESQLLVPAGITDMIELYLIAFLGSKQFSMQLSYVGPPHEP